ncbi:DUF3696 domain-containing protein [Methylovulum psychrotolerans]|uniref:DUF3696 domain-containing protein n=1 Tax=Methylovulum psychrotolerans TaxID=1704499 RepID=A0A2S5CN96_9GAMM|nr:DUF3696 domain-containing protein [Methylovulum psychrotolerans]POZ52227.1 hypothetical protein AADEFJLK_01701 [Methylovulum psychrotolerans]
MLTELHVANFKAWQALDIRLGRVTGLFGTNSSGKTSILQFLLLLKQTKNATDRGIVLDLGSQGQLVNLGTFKDLIYGHEEKQPLTWKIKWKRDETAKNVKNSQFIGFESAIDLETNAKVLFKNKEMKLHFLSYRFGDLYFEMKLENERYVYNSYEKDERKSGYSFRTQEKNISPSKTHLFPSQHPLLIEVIPGSDFSSDWILSSLESAYEDMMDQIYYLGPLREYPKREYQWSGSGSTDVGYRGEGTINAILSATFRGETRTLSNTDEPKPFQEVIAYWLKQLGLIDTFAIKELAEGSSLYRAIVKRDPESPEAFLTDVGFGVSQVLPALVLLYYVPEGSTVLMEQPEIHLHPSVQSGLADVILQVAQHRNIQVIVESHSEHLLRRFQRRVAEAHYPAEDIKLYFCANNGGKATLADLDIDEFGDIRNWPDNFFGDEMAEIAATRTAALKRKMQAV